MSRFEIVRPWFDRAGQLQYHQSITSTWIVSSGKNSTIWSCKKRQANQLTCKNLLCFPEGSTGRLSVGTVVDRDAPR